MLIISVFAYVVVFVDLGSNYDMKICAKQKNTIMKTKSILFLTLFAFAFLTLACNKDNDEDNPGTGDTYMKAKVNGTNFEAKKAVAGYSSTQKILTIVGLDEDGQNALEFQITNYTGTGKYDIDENIVLQWQHGAYINPGGNAGFINVTADNGTIFKGTFECHLVSVLNPDDKLEITQGEFRASTKL